MSQDKKLSESYTHWLTMLDHYKSRGYAPEDFATFAARNKIPITMKDLLILLSDQKKYKAFIATFLVKYMNLAPPMKEKWVNILAAQLPIDDVVQMIPPSDKDLAIKTAFNVIGGVVQKEEESYSSKLAAAAVPAIAPVTIMKKPAASSPIVKKLLVPLTFKIGDKSFTVHILPGISPANKQKIENSIVRFWYSKKSGSLMTHDEKAEFEMYDGKVKATSAYATMMCPIYHCDRDRCAHTSDEKGMPYNWLIVDEDNDVYTPTTTFKYCFQLARDSSGKFIRYDDGHIVMRTVKYDKKNKSVTYLNVNDFYDEIL